MIDFPRTGDEDIDRALDAIALRAFQLATQAGLISGSFTFTPAAVAATSSAAYAVAPGGDVPSQAVVGLRPGQQVSVTWPSRPPTGLVLDCWCDAADTLKVRFSNVSGGALTPPAGAYAFAGTTQI